MQLIAPVYMQAEAKCASLPPWCVVARCGGSICFLPLRQKKRFESRRWIWEKNDTRRSEYAAEEVLTDKTTQTHLMLVMLPVSEPSLHLSSWLATICRSASSSLVRRSNCNSCKERERVKMHAYPVTRTVILSFTWTTVVSDMSWIVAK